MSRNAATNDQNGQNKRLRFDSTASDTSGKKAERKSPKLHSEAFVQNHVASLQPQIATILAKLGVQHLDLLHRAFNKKKQLDRMADDDTFIPRSARLEFTFHMSKKAEQSPEFIALKQETDDHLISFRKILRDQVLKATKIELDTLIDTIQEDFARSIRVIAEAFLICDNKNDATSPHEVLSFMLQSDNDAARLLKYINVASSDEFYEVYKSVHSLPSFPIRSAALQQSQSTNATDNNNSSIFFQTQSQQSQQQVTQQHDPYLGQTDKIKRAIEAVFVESFDAYVLQCQKNEIDLSLKKLTVSHFTEESTHSTQMELDQEPAVNRNQLKDLIRKESISQNKTLHSELNKLQAQLRGLDRSKERRGRSQVTGASKQKQKKTSAKGVKSKSSTSQQPRRKGQASRPTGRKAEESDSGSDASNVSLKKKQKRKSGGKRQQRSRTRRSK
jgi:hypothetical protein